MVLGFVPTDLTGRGGSNGCAGGAPPGAGALVMVLLVASLAMGIGALIVAYFVLRANAAVWPPPGTPALPRGLWLSTAIILASSGTMHWAVVAGRRGDSHSLRRATAFTLGLAVAFLLSQIVNWGLAVAARMPPTSSMYANLFYLFTGLHGLHIVAGIVPLTIVTYKAWQDLYAPQHMAGVKYCATYWHFVDVAWLAMYGALLIR